MVTGLSPQQVWKMSRIGMFPGVLPAIEPEGGHIPRRAFECPTGPSRYTVEGPARIAADAVYGPRRETQRSGDCGSTSFEWDFSNNGVLRTEHDEKGIAKRTDILRKHKKSRPDGFICTVMIAGRLHRPTVNPIDFFNNKSYNCRSTTSRKHRTRDTVVRLHFSHCRKEGWVCYERVP